MQLRVRTAATESTAAVNCPALMVDDWAVRPAHSKVSHANRMVSQVHDLGRQRFNRV